MVDALCLDDLDLFGGELDDPLAELAQDLYHRIIEAPGSNLDDPARGFGLEGRLSGAGRPGTIATTIQHGLESEMRKDKRVRDARASVTSPASDEYRVDLQIVADEGVLGISLVKDGSGVRRVA
jgi:hypothetical protein